MDNAPIVLFVYNRPQHVKKLLDSLANCKEAAASELFIFSDGPKTAQDQEAVNEVRILVKSRNWCGKQQVIEQNRNIGVANSIISGITQIVQKYGKIIVLEDDLILSPYFLTFMNEALEFYKDIPRVMHISGFMFPVKGELPETFFYRATTAWGWATWERAWNKFEPDASKSMNEIIKQKRQWEFDVQGSYAYCATLKAQAKTQKRWKMITRRLADAYCAILKAQAKGRIDAWDIRWYASVFLSNGLCLHSGRSFSCNIGHDGTGIHCGTTDKFQVMLANEKINNFTQDINESQEAVRLMVEFYQSVELPVCLSLKEQILNLIFPKRN